MEEQAKALAAEQGLAWVEPTLDPYASYDLVEGLVRLPAEPAPLTEAEVARLDELDASYDEHAAILEDEDSAERSEEHTSELQSLMRISYAVFCLKKKKKKKNYINHNSNKGS